MEIEFAAHIQYKNVRIVRNVKIKKKSIRIRGFIFEV